MGVENVTELSMRGIISETRVLRIWGEKADNQALLSLLACGRRQGISEWGFAVNLGSPVHGCDLDSM